MNRFAYSLANLKRAVKAAPDKAAWVVGDHIVSGAFIVLRNHSLETESTSNLAVACGVGMPQREAPDTATVAMLVAKVRAIPKDAAHTYTATKLLRELAGDGSQGRLYRSRDGTHWLAIDTRFLAVIGNPAILYSVDGHATDDPEDEGAAVVMGWRMRDNDGVSEHLSWNATP